MGAFRRRFLLLVCLSGLIFVASCSHTRLTIRVFEINSPVTGLAFCSNKQMLFASSFKEKLTTINIIDWTRSEFSVGGKGETDSLAISSGGDLLAVSKRNLQTIIISYQNSGRRETLIGHQGETYASAFSPNGNSLITGGKDGLIIVWDVSSGKIKRTIDAGEIITSLQFSPTQNHFIGADVNGTITLWDGESGEVLHQEKGAHTDVVKLAYSPDGSRIVSAGADNRIRIWDKSFNKLTLIPTRKYWAMSASFIDGGQCLVAGCSDGKMRFYDLKKNTVRVLWNSRHWYGMSRIAVSGDGMTIAGSSDSRIAIISRPHRRTE